MFKRVLAKVAAGAIVAGAAVSLGASVASAHVSIVTYGTTFTAGATNVVYFRVPHGCSGNPTSKVSIDIPSSVTGVKIEARPGWTASRTLNGSGAVTQVVWTARGAIGTAELAGNIQPDWQFADFGIRATLNGSEGTVITFDHVKQYCDYDEAGAALGTPLIEDWTGANAPSLTLVGTTKKVATATDLATLRGDATSVRTDLTSLVSRVEALEATLTLAQTTIQRVLGHIGITQAPAAVSLANGKLSYVIDLSTVWRQKTLGIVVNGVTVGNARLDRVGDAASAVKVADGVVSSGTTVDFVWNGFTLASATL